LVFEGRDPLGQGDGLVEARTDLEDGAGGSNACGGRGGWIVEDGAQGGEGVVHGGGGLLGGAGQGVIESVVEGDLEVGGRQIEVGGALGDAGLAGSVGDGAGGEHGGEEAPLFGRELPVCIFLHVFAGPGSVLVCLAARAAAGTASTADRAAIRL
jgi:hypothetical protein